MIKIILVISFLLKSSFGGELIKQGTEWKCGDQTWPLRYVCDGYEQCNDNSDEGKEPFEGCNLYPNSTCPSPRGKRQYKCQRTDECFAEEYKAVECETSTGPPSRDCLLTSLDGSEISGWKCKDGRCIDTSHICDGNDNCDGGSDEGTDEAAEYGGCCVVDA